MTAALMAQATKNLPEFARDFIQRCDPFRTKRDFILCPKECEYWKGGLSNMPEAGDFQHTAVGVRCKDTLKAASGLPMVTYKSLEHFGISFGAAAGARIADPVQTRAFDRPLGPLEDHKSFRFRDEARVKARMQTDEYRQAVEEQMLDFAERSRAEEEAQQPRVGEGRKALAPPQGPASSNAELPAMPKDVAPALPTIREAVAASTGAAAQSQAQLPVPPVEASSPAAETPVETAGPTAEGPAAAEAPVETAGPTAEGPAAEAPVETAGPTAEGPAAESPVEAAGPSPVEAAGPPPASMWYQTQPAAKAQARLDEEEVRKEWQKELAAVKLEEEGGRAGPSALAPTQGQSSEAQSQRRAKASRWVSPLTTGTPGSSSIIRSKRDRLLAKIWSAKRSSTLRSTLLAQTQSSMF